MTIALDSQVLVLNKNYSPINITTVRKALNKIINGNAEIVSVENDAYIGYNFDSWMELSLLKQEFGMDAEDELMGSEGFALLVPRIIRTLNYDKQYRQPIRLSRRNIILRDANICQFCGKKFPTDKLTLDHVMPRAQGGINSWENLVSSCYKCNSKKGCRTPEEANMKLLRTPVRPETHVTFEIPKDVKRYKNWDAFLSEIYWNIPLVED